MAKFEIAVHNEKVRQLVADDRHHDQFTDDWADMRYIEITALDEEQARVKFEETHPGAQGFVIDDIVEIG